MGSGGFLFLICRGFCVKCRVTTSFTVIYRGFSVCKATSVVFHFLFSVCLLRKYRKTVGKS